MAEFNTRTDIDEITEYLQHVPAIIKQVEHKITNDPVFSREVYSTNLLKLIAEIRDTAARLESNPRVPARDKFNIQQG